MSARNILVPLLLVCLIGMPASHAEDSDISLAIDTKELTLAVRQGESVIEVFENIAIGSNGATWDKQLGDEKTPLGNFRVMEVRKSERFVMFIAIDYPNLDHVRRAWESKRIAPGEYSALISALRDNGLPPQNTRLGGHLGIHGLGEGDPYVHDNFNWTNGCIALGNAQLARLLTWVRPGTPVIVH